MKKKVDIGLSYIKELGITTERDNKGIYNSLVARYGKANADEIASDIETMEKMNSISVFKTACENLELTKIYYGGIYADKIRKYANWLDSNVGMIGQNILLYTGGFGLEIPFIADKFRDDAITVLMENEQRRRVAEELLKQQNISNVTFTDKKLEDLEEKSFDAVITLDAVYQEEQIELYDADYKLLFEQVESHKNCFELIARRLTRLMRPMGFLIVMEEANPTPATLGFLYALNDIPCGPVATTVDYPYAKVLDEEHALQCFAAQYMVPADKIDMDNAWSASLHIDRNDNEFTETQAELMLENFHGDLIEGSFLVNDKFEKQAKFAIYHCRQDEGLLLYYFRMFDSSYLGFYSKEIMDQIKSDMDERIHTFEQTGCKRKKFKLVGNQELLMVEKGDLSLGK